LTISVNMSISSRSFSFPAQRSTSSWSLALSFDTFWAFSWSSQKPSFEISLSSFSS
jgi:hypothetical protein